MTQTEERLGLILGDKDKAELAMLWMRNHLQRVAKVEMAKGNEAGALTLDRVAYELSEHE